MGPKLSAPIFFGSPRGAPKFWKPKIVSTQTVTGSFTTVLIG